MQVEALFSSYLRRVRVRGFAKQGPGEAGRPTGAGQPGQARACNMRFLAA